MGMAGMVFSGGLKNLGAGSFGSRSASVSNSYGTGAGLVTTPMPETPTAPTPVETGIESNVTANAGMEAEREREKQAALLRQQQSAEVYTSGLGAVGAAGLAKKTLLGG